MENIFQSKEWEEFKLSTGYQKSYRIGDILVLQKNLPLGYTMLYSPMVNQESKIKNQEFFEKIREIGIQNRSIFYRLELDVPVHDSQFIIHNSGLRKAFEEMQPEHTLVLNLSESEDKILSQMKPKGRYNIRVAERQNVLVEKDDSVDFFYDMYSKTGRRHKITYRAKSYFQKLLEILVKSSYASVYNAYVKKGSQKTPLASAIIVYSGKKAIYMFGSSSDEHKNLMAPYKLHWQIIKDAKKAGFETYDFFGVAPDNNPSHPWAGVTRFKKQFGGRQIATFGSYDLIFKPLAYLSFKIAEKIRRK